MNNWVEATANMGVSNCQYFKLEGAFTSAGLKYYDLANNSELSVFKDMKVKWEQGGEIVGIVNSTQVDGPPAEDTDYDYVVYDRFGCEASMAVTYYSIVPKASFTVDPSGGEAPLEVAFSNTSVNADVDKYEWYFFRDINDIKKEAENTTEPIDSIMEQAFNQNPVYTYENTGSYMVKLVAKKKSELYTCTDTFYYEDYIKVDSSFVLAPNVFTPNGDGLNDDFVVKFYSMKSVKISIFNRWGRVVHVYSNKNIRGFEDSVEESVWDGRIGNKYASPGVYYYVVEGFGRDDETRWANGFVHLFREKN